MLQVFCSKSHREASRHRRRDFEIKYRGRCAKPHKRWFRTPLDAYEFATLHGFDDQHPYLCICSGWHLTSQGPRQWSNKQSLASYHVEKRKEEPRGLH